MTNRDIRPMKNASEAEKEIEEALAARTPEPNALGIVGGEGVSTVEQIVTNSDQRSKIENLVDQGKGTSDDPALGSDDGPEPGTRPGIPDGGINRDLGSLLGSAPSNAESLAANLGTNSRELGRASGQQAFNPDGSPKDATAGGSIQFNPDGSSRDEGSSNGRFGLGNGRISDSGSQLGDVAAGSADGISAIGKGSIANDLSQATGAGPIPVAYSDEGVKAGSGILEVAKANNDMPSVTPDRLPGAAGDVLRETLREIDGVKSDAISSDGVVSKHILPNGTIMVTNVDNGTSTIIEPSGKITTKNDSGDVIDVVQLQSGRVDEEGTLPSEYQAVFDAMKADFLGREKTNSNTGDIDYHDDPTSGGGAGGEIVDLKRTLLGDGGRVDSGLPTTGNGTIPSAPGLPGNVDPTEDTSMAPSMGLNDDPLEGLGQQTLKPSASSGGESEDEEEETDEEESE